MDQQIQPWYYIVLLILAGEGVFILPFVMPRIFRPTVLDVFSINNVEIGQCFSVYGIVALLAYLFGGVIADYFQPGRLMGIALALTALGGVYMTTYPTLVGLLILYGYWGFTTIFLFWAAMIKATRLWGSKNGQGKAFSFLDGGRGLVAASFASIGIFVISFFAHEAIETYPFEQRQNIFKQVIWAFTGIVFLISLIVFFGLTPKSNEEITSKRESIKWSQLKKLLNIPSIYFMMLIILTGYSGYKVSDIFSQYAKDVMGFEEIKAAGVGTILLYIRPILGLVIGFLADKTKPILMLSIGFVFMIIGSILMASGTIGPSLIMYFFVSIIATSIGIYSIRCLYFAIMDEAKIPVLLTGTAVGLVSVVGYTPDIFMGPIIGYFLDSFPGELGHQYLFGFIASVGFIGLLSSLVIMKLSKEKTT
jgi:MFS family permease